MGSDARQTTPCTDAGYGLHPSCKPAVADFAAAVTEIVETHDPVEVPERVRAALTPLLATEDLLDPVHRTESDDHYTRHVLYADPEHRFTVLALVWKPGQTTTVHGHAAWGAVGVYEGEPNVCCYDCGGDEGDPTPSETSDERFSPGATCAVQPGFGDAHRIYNGTDRTVITIHAYGLDLVVDPESINLPLAS